MAVVTNKTVKKQVTTLVEEVHLELSQDEANALWTLLYTGVGSTSVTSLGLRDLSDNLRYAATLVPGVEFESHAVDAASKPLKSQAPTLRRLLP